MTTQTETVCFLCPYAGRALPGHEFCPACEASLDRNRRERGTCVVCRAILWQGGSLCPSCETANVVREWWHSFLAAIFAFAAISFAAWVFLR